MLEGMLCTFSGQAIARGRLLTKTRSDISKA